MIVLKNLKSIFGPDLTSFFLGYHSHSHHICLFVANSCHTSNSKGSFHINACPPSSLTLFISLLLASNFITTSTPCPCHRSFMFIACSSFFHLFTSLLTQLRFHGYLWPFSCKSFLICLAMPLSLLGKISTCFSLNSPATLHLHSSSCILLEKDQMIVLAGITSKP